MLYFGSWFDPFDGRQKIVNFFRADIVDIIGNDVLKICGYFKSYIDFMMCFVYSGI